MSFSIVRSLRTSSVNPEFELRLSYTSTTERDMQIWQLKCPASPQLKKSVCLASIGRRELDVVEIRIRKVLLENGIHLPAGQNNNWISRIPEDLALKLTLLFKAIAPLRKVHNINAIATGIEEMEREEAAYWIGMVLYRTHPRKVLAALRTLFV